VCSVMWFCVFVCVFVCVCVCVYTLACAFVCVCVLRCRCLWVYARCVVLCSVSVCIQTSSPSLSRTISPCMRVFVRACMCVCACVTYCVTYYRMISLTCRQTSTGRGYRQFSFTQNVLPRLCTSRRRFPWMKIKRVWSRKGGILGNNVEK